MSAETGGADRENLIAGASQKSAKRGIEMEHTIAGALRKLVKRRTDGENSIVGGPIVVYVDRDTSVFIVTLW